MLVYVINCIDSLVLGYFSSLVLGYFSSCIYTLVWYKNYG